MIDLNAPPPWFKDVCGEKGPFASLDDTVHVWVNTSLLNALYLFLDSSPQSQGQEASSATAPQFPLKARNIPMFYKNNNVYGAKLFESTLMFDGGYGVFDWHNC